MIATANIEQAMIDRLTLYFDSAPKPYPTQPIINNPDISKAKAEGGKIDGALNIFVQLQHTKIDETGSSNRWRHFANFQILCLAQNLRNRHSQRVGEQEIGEIGAYQLADAVVEALSGQTLDAELAKHNPDLKIHPLQPRAVVYFPDEHREGNGRTAYVVMIEAIYDTAILEWPRQTNDDFNAINLSFGVGLDENQTPAADNSNIITFFVGTPTPAEAGGLSHEDF